MPSNFRPPLTFFIFSCWSRLGILSAAGLVTLAVLLSQACSTARLEQEIKRPELISSLDNGTLLTSNGSAVEADGLPTAEAAYILIGESHNNACDHKVQARLLRQMAVSHPRVSLGLEMVPESRQATLDRFNSGAISLEELERELDWKNLWGHPFALYAPLLSAARESSVDVYGLNLDRQLLEAVKARGLSALSPEKRSRLPDRIVPPPKGQSQSLTEAFEAHTAFLSDGGNATASKEQFFLVQSLWDSKMAATAARVRRKTGGQVVIFAGSGHVEYGWGIAHRLQEYDPGSDVLSLLPWRGRNDLEPEAADFFFFCPSTVSSLHGSGLSSFDSSCLSRHEGL